MLVSHLASPTGGSEAWDVNTCIKDSMDMPVEEDRVIKIEFDTFHHVQFLLLL